MPLMRVCVDGQTIGEVISAWTGIPAGKMLKDEISTVLTLEDVLGGRVIGQNHALEQIAERIRTSKAQSGRSQQTHRRFHAGGTERRGQDRDGADAGGPDVWRRAQYDHAST